MKTPLINTGLGKAYEKYGVSSFLLENIYVNFEQQPIGHINDEPIFGDKDTLKAIDPLSISSALEHITISASIPSFYKTTNIEGIELPLFNGESLVSGARSLPEGVLSFSGTNKLSKNVINSLYQVDELGLINIECYEAIYKREISQDGLELKISPISIKSIKVNDWTIPLGVNFSPTNTTTVVSSEVLTVSNIFSNSSVGRIIGLVNKVANGLSQLSGRKTGIPSKVDLYISKEARTKLSDK